MSNANNKKGGAGPSLSQQIRHSEEYEAWKRAVFIRDRFTCQECGKRNGRKQVIQVHHLKELSDIIKENEIRTIDEALLCPLLWDISNGQTLCKDCHEKTGSFPKQLAGKITGKKYLRY